MAVKYIQNKNNALGSLGSIALIGGTLTGNPFLSALGTSIGAANSIMNGNANADNISSLHEALKSVLGGWVNPAQGSIAKTNPNTVTPEQIQEIMHQYGRGGCF